AYVAVYPDAFVGTPDMEILVWDDDGFGDPGTLRATVTIPYASLPTSLAYAVADLTSFGLVYSNGEEYHIGVNCPTAGDGDTLAILSDDATSATGRHSFYIPSFGGWYTWTTDYGFTIASEFCAADIPYSECYTREYNCDPWYVWNLPDDYGDDYFNMRFSVGGPETLKTVSVAFYDAGDQSGDVDIFVWGSSAGFPDLSNVLYQTTVAFADIVYYPDYVTLDLSAENIVLRDDFHIGWSPNDVTGGLTYGLSDDASCGTIRSSEYFSGAWGTMLNDWSADVNFVIKADLCKDEFSTCMSFENICLIAGYNSVPNGTPDGAGNIRTGIYEGYDSWGIGCRLETIYFGFYFPESVPTLYTTNTDVKICASDGLTWNGLPGAPGTLLGTVTLTPADYVAYPAMTEVDVASMNIRFDDRIWVGALSQSPDGTHGFALLVDDGTCGGPGRAIWWDDNTSSFSASNNFIDIDVCCTPPLERTCTPGEDWPTAMHDYRRTGASFNSTGDARCKQSTLWWVNDVNGMNSNRPTIYDGKVIVCFNNHIAVYDVNTGAVLWTLSGLPYINATFRNSVTVQDGYVYFGGGNLPAFTKADVNTGAVAWVRTITTTPLTGNTQYTNSVILNIDGADAIFFQTEDGKLQALDCATGANLAGYPVQLNGVGTETISSNGVDVIYMATDGAYGTGYGSIYAIDAATGAINWQLNEADLAGHSIDGDDGTFTKEVFRGPIAVDDDGALYVMSSFSTEGGDGSGYAAPSGARYRISPNGTIVWATAGGWQGTTSTYNGYEGPILDASNVYFHALGYWTSETSLLARDKLKGKLVWTYDGFYPSTTYMDGALSCEPLVPDVLYAGNTYGNFFAVNADNGTTLFGYQYYSTGSYRSCGISIDPSHVVFTNRIGDVFVMNEQVDRPRLVILKTDELQAVPFFSPLHYSVTFDDVFMNNGCADLTGDLTADEAASAMVVTSVNPTRIERMAAAADQMVENSYPTMVRHLQPRDLDRFDESGYSKDTYSNTAAYAPPAWLWSITNPTFAVPDGGTYSITYDVNGPLITRGPHYCYVTIASNDQYYLNVPGGNPAVQLGVLGGCLESSLEMAFGTSDQNVAPVMSTSETGSQEVALFRFDEDTTRYWQGGLVYGVSQHRMAFNFEGWSSSDPVNLWNLTLPDINCFNTCTPNLTSTPQTLGAMSHDGGATYDPIQGYIGTARYIDSLLDMNCYGGGWDWYATDCPFSNDSTIGLAVDQFMYGVTGEPLLNNVVIYRLNVTERNGRAMPGVYFGALQDFDLDGTYNGYDVAKFDAAHSISYGSPCYGVTMGDHTVAGMGKIPMDVDPMLGVRTLDAQQAMWNDGITLDSMYFYMTSQPGQTWSLGVDPNFPCAVASGSDDREFFYSFVSHDFAANETWSFGVYMFDFPHGDINNATFFTDFAVLVNQFAGFGRGDINGDGSTNLVDVVALYNLVNASGNGPKFQHLADVNNDGGVDNADVLYMANYWFCAGPAPVGSWVLPIPCP
ncbi:MAG: PQQ-binding-like beta-propeller repeat protein, partial [candidate division Zixibacteria bacterium]|nr:PQQ-binding-like beta-propeller repeat protein [candidate division Zixibacteria bacterium]